MRATFYGFLAAGLTVLTSSGANASFAGSGHFGGFQPIMMGHHWRGVASPWLRFPRRNLGLLSSSSFFLPGAVPNDASAAPQSVIIVAPNYISAAPVRSQASSGPRIIYIGAQPKAGDLPVVVYGISPGLRTD
jgi:hypothetical protein